MSATARFDTRTPPGRWVVDVIHDGDRKRFSADPVSAAPFSKLMARDFAKSVNKQIAKGAWQTAAKPTTAVETRTTLRTFADRWLRDTAANRKASTNRFYRTALDALIYPALGSVAVASLDRRACVAFARGLLTLQGQRTNARLRLGTRLGALRTLSTVLTAAVDADPPLLNANPAFKLARYTRDPDEVKREIVPWSREETNRALDVARVDLPYWYPLLVVALRTGLRVGELLELRWDDVDAARGELHVQRAWSSATRERYSIDAAGTRTTERVGAKAGHVTTPKSKRARIVDLTPHVLATLAAHKAAMRAAAFRAGRPMPVLVFVAPRGKRLHLPNIQDRVLDPLIASAKLRRISPHGMRHTYATQLLLAGTPVAYVSQQLGHADVETTLRHYAHWIDSGSATPAAHLLDDASDQIATAKVDAQKRTPRQANATRTQQKRNKAKSS